MTGVQTCALPICSPYLLSDNWLQMHKIIVPDEEKVLLDAVEKSVIHFKSRKVMMMLEENQHLIKEAHLKGEDFMPLLEKHVMLENIKIELSKTLGIDIIK